MWTNPYKTPNNTWVRTYESPQHAGLDQTNVPQVCSQSATEKVLYTSCSTNKIKKSLILLIKIINKVILLLPLATCIELYKLSINVM